MCAPVKHASIGCWPGQRGDQRAHDRLRRLVDIAGQRPFIRPGPLQRLELALEQGQRPRLTGCGVQLAQALREFLPEFTFSMPQGGASLWVQAPAWVDAAELGEMARAHGVLIEAGDVFFAKPPYPCPFFRLRLSSIAAGQIAAGIRALGLAVSDLARARGEKRSNAVKRLH